MIIKHIRDIEELKKISFNIRKDILLSLAEAGSGHTGASLGLADVFTCLYFAVMNHNPQDPSWPKRDRLVLSIGHVAPVLYAALAHAGYFPKEELMTLRKLGSRLQGHPGRDHGLPGIELSAGSLGQGLSVSAGMAIAARYNNENHRIYCVMGDGELQEGSVWEAAMSAAHHKLDNICVIVDRNKLQIDGKTSDVMELEPLGDKWRSFGWQVCECNGNNHEEILSAFDTTQELNFKPKIILAHTLMGKGVSTVENDYRWHGKAPSKEEAQRFIAMLV
ncbi:MAG TPA: transketolase [Bacteroidales bacterium]|nr:transketolase [Bacteroidales bacterium]